MRLSLSSIALAACVGFVACSDKTIGGDGVPAGDPVAQADGGGDPTDGDGDSLAGDGVTGDGVAGDSLTGDGLSGDGLAGNSRPLGCGNEGLCIELTWDSASGDLDLHLSKDAGNWCSDQACYFGNCKEGAAYRVDWDATVGMSDGDPSLEDDTWGTGPEVIRLLRPPAGDYTVGVRFEPFGTTPVTASVVITSAGVVVNSFSRSMAPGSFWQVAMISADITVSTVSTSDRICSPGAWICNSAVDACPPG